MFNMTTNLGLLYYLLVMVFPVSTLKTTRSLYEMAVDYEDEKNSVIALTDRSHEHLYDDFYAENDIEYKYESSMDIIFYGPPETFMRLDPESIIHILANIKIKHLIPINRVLQAWDIITDGKTAAYLQGREYLAFGSLLNFIPEEELYYANMGDENVRRYFAQYSDGLEFRKFGILVSAYRRYFGDTWYSNASKIIDLGYMICGFTPTELKKISPAVMKELTYEILSKVKRCTDEQVQTLYDLAVQPEVFGDPYKWTSHEVSRLGILLKCIPGHELSSIQLEAMPAITEEVIKQFSQNKLTLFTQQQIMKMQPLARRIYILRIQLKSSLDVNELSKRDAIYKKPLIILIMSNFVYLSLVN